MNGDSYVGSGFYYYDTIADLSKGYFITAAHCVMTTENGLYAKITEAYMQNPISNQWIPVNTNQIYIDGVADVALIRTDIDFTNYQDYCLQLHSGDPVNSGDPCYVVGNPGDYDEDSFSVGCIRDANYTDPGGYQITNSIFVNAPGISGNSGGPIVNPDGHVIGVFTFGRSGMECYGGGSSYQVLKKTLPILKQNMDNKTKLYLGMDWYTPSPLLMKYYHSTPAFGTEGVYINVVSDDSPFYDVIQASDLLLGCQLQSGSDAGREMMFGRNQNQLSPGELIYCPRETIIEIRYKRISSGTDVLTATVILNKTYNDVSPLLDSYLQKGLSYKTNASTLCVNMIKYDLH